MVPHIQGIFCSVNLVLVALHMMNHWTFQGHPRTLCGRQPTSHAAALWAWLYCRERSRKSSCSASIVSCFLQEPHCFNTMNWPPSKGFGFYPLTLDHVLHRQKLRCVLDVKPRIPRMFGHGWDADTLNLGTTPRSTGLVVYIGRVGDWWFRCGSVRDGV